MDVRFQDPPADYDRKYFSLLLRDIRQLFQTVMTPSTLTTGLLVFTIDPRGCPLNGNGLRPGTVYCDAGTLKMVLPDTGYAPSFLATAHLGTVIATGS